MTVSSAAVNQPQTVSGSRSHVRPGQRQATMVAMVLTALRMEAIPKSQMEPSQGWIGCPSGDCRAAGYEGCAEQDSEREDEDPERERVEGGESHALCADLRGQDERTEAGLRREREDEEEH